MAFFELLDEWWPLVASFAAGLVLGGIFFGGLWWTVRQLGTTSRPGLLFAASFLVRTAVVMGGVYWLSAGQWQRIAACLAGMIVMRAILTRRWGPNQIAKADRPAG